MKRGTTGLAGWLFAVVLGLALGPTAAMAQASEDEAKRQAEKAWQMWEKMEKRQGKIDLPGGVAQLDVHDAFVYLSPADTRTVLEEFWGNPPGGETLGMLLPARFSPFDEESWAVTLGYVDDGHVSDADAGEIDYQELLEDMQAAVKEESAERVKAGYPAIDLVGWAEPPHYDPVSKKLHWAKELAFNGDNDHVLNYNLRVLGREGVLVMNFIAGMNQLADINSSLERVAAMAEFKEGQRYADYDPKTDKLAAYGVGAIVAGGALAKSGMWATILLALKKLWFVIAAAVVGVFKFFTRKKE